MPEILVNITIILFLILLNGVFAMSELAVVSARTARLEQMSADGNKGAAVALDLARSPNRFLSTVQVGITLIAILSGAFGGANIAGQLAIPLQDLPIIGPYAQTISLTLVVGIITFLSVVLGELVPKRIALGDKERIAAIVARPMRALSVIAIPIVRLLSMTTDAVLKLLGVPSAVNEEVSEEEIKVMVQQSAQAGVIEEAERDMVERIFRLGDRPLEAMMTPRPEIVWLDINGSDEEIRDLIQLSHHSRFPVCDGDLDNILGVVRTRDLLFDCLEGKAFDIRNLMQDALIAPEKMDALKALERYKETGQHMALLVDEYGGMEGLVTLIDILEAIVGDIPTMKEIVEPPITQRKENSWLVEGLIAIDDFKEAFEIRSLPGEGEYQTLGGFVVFMLGSLPVAGSHFGWGGYRFEVADMDRNRVDKVLVDKAPAKEGEDDIEDRDE